MKSLRPNQAPERTGGQTTRFLRTAVGTGRSAPIRWGAVGALTMQALEDDRSRYQEELHGDQ